MTILICNIDLTFTLAQSLNIYYFFYNKSAIEVGAHAIEIYIIVPCISEWISQAIVWVIVSLIS